MALAALRFLGFSETAVDGVGQLAGFIIVERLQDSRQEIATLIPDVLLEKRLKLFHLGKEFVIVPRRCFDFSQPGAQVLACLGCIRRERLRLRMLAKQRQKMLVFHVEI